MTLPPSPHAHWWYKTRCSRAVFLHTFSTSRGVTKREVRTAPADAEAAFCARVVVGWGDHRDSGACCASRGSAPAMHNSGRRSGGRQQRDDSIRETGEASGVVVYPRRLGLGDGARRGGRGVGGGEGAEEKGRDE